MKTSLINIAILITASMLILVACSTNTQNQNTTAGAVAGAVLGGIAGSAIGSGTGQLVAMGVGAVAGGFLGAAIGHNMESADTEKMNNTMDHNQVRKTSKWTNKNTDAKYSMTPMSGTMRYKGEVPCRRYYGTVTTDGKKEVMKGIACRQSDGSWKTMS